MPAELAEIVQVCNACARLKGRESCPEHRFKGLAIGYPAYAEEDVYDWQRDGL
jgi:hypothetical protein